MRRSFGLSGETPTELPIGGSAASLLFAAFHTFCQKSRPRGGRLDATPDCRTPLRVTWTNLFTICRCMMVSSFHCTSSHGLFSSLSNKMRSGTTHVDSVLHLIAWVISGIETTGGDYARDHGRAYAVTRSHGEGGADGLRTGAPEIQPLQYRIGCCQDFDCRTFPTHVVR